MSVQTQIEKLKQDIQILHEDRELSRIPYWGGVDRTSVRVESAYKGHLRCIVRFWSDLKPGHYDYNNSVAANNEVEVGGFQFVIPCGYDKELLRHLCTNVKW